MQDQSNAMDTDMEKALHLCAIYHYKVLVKYNQMECNHYSFTICVNLHFKISWTLNHSFLNYKGHHIQGALKNLQLYGVSYNVPLNGLGTFHGS